MNRDESFSFSSSPSLSIEKIEDDNEDEQMSVGSWSQCMRNRERKLSTKEKLLFDAA